MTCQILMIEKEAVGPTRYPHGGTDSWDRGVSDSVSSLFTLVSQEVFAQYCFEHLVILRCIDVNSTFREENGSDIIRMI